MVELAFLEDPYRKTGITEIAAVRGQGLLLPRSIYYARSTRYGHPQPGDLGHLVTEGHKLKLERVGWRDGDLVHVVRGPAPRKGARVLCHLDWGRRHVAMRAHGALHLVAHAVAAEGRGAADALEVVGGGHVRAALRLKDPRPEGLADVLRRVNALVEEDLPVSHGWFARDAAARRATAQHVPLAEVAPGEATLRMVDVGEITRVPCDAPNVRRTGEVGRVVVVDARFRPDRSCRAQFRLAEVA